MTTETQVLYTIKETAAKLHVHPQTVRQLHRNGELVFVRIGRQHLTRAEDLDKFITEHLSNID
jgi:excisionase family DNA binding protein